MKCLAGIIDRGGRCYELTAKILLQEPGSEGWTLVHARIRYGPRDLEPTCQHCFVDLGHGQIYDLDMGYTTERALRACIGNYVVDRRYTKQEVIHHTRASGNYGPWYVTIPCRTPAATFMSSALTQRKENGPG